MKKIIVIAGILLLSITTYAISQKFANNRITEGMTKNEVNLMLGVPERLLELHRTADETFEKIQYRTSSDDVYVLEFINDQLDRHEVYKNKKNTPFVISVFNRSI